jgi:hypothetical protein
MKNNVYYLKKFRISMVGKLKFCSGATQPMARALLAEQRHPVITRTRGRELGCVLLDTAHTAAAPNRTARRRPPPRTAHHRRKRGLLLIDFLMHRCLGIG